MASENYHKNSAQYRSFLKSFCSIATLVVAGAAALAAPLTATAQEDERPIEVNPFEDPNLIYLEADELIDNQETGEMIARGDVEARYGERILRADEVVYNLESGRVVARGNVTILNEDGSSQFANEIELSEELNAGIAENFTARLAEGGLVAARYAVRRSDEGVDLYNAYYTACGCTDDPSEIPTWRIKARRVTQDKEDQMIYYRNATFELKGVPIFFTPFLAHPDPSAGRRSGLLIPNVGRSGRYGVFYEQPYYWAISDYSELTVTPRLMERVNPLLMMRYRKKFYSGDIDLQGSFTYDEWFDSDGDEFTDADVFRDPQEVLRGERWRSHFLGRGEFDINETFDWGFGLEYATDDLYLRRYDIEERREDFGLYWADNRRLVEQLYVQGQTENFRMSAATVGFLSLRTNVTRSDVTGLVNVSREDDSLLPVALPKIEVDQYFTDPLLGGRIHGFGDVTVLQRAQGDDYMRGTAGAEWSKSWFTPQGINIKPFASARFDTIELSTNDYPGRVSSDLLRQSVNEDITAYNSEDREFSRSLGQVGVDARWAFYKPGDNVDFVIEPRLQVTASFGDSKLNEYQRMIELTNRVNNNIRSDTFLVAEDGLSIDLDHTLLFQSNKATGFDLWQEGIRTDVGAAFQAHWGGDSSASLFLGQSFISEQEFDYGLGTGLGTDSSDIVALGEVSLWGDFDLRTRLRLDEDGLDLRRIDTEMNYTGDRLSGSLRYYKIDNPFSTATILDPELIGDPIFDTAPPPEEISGMIDYQVTDNWSVSYSLFRDLEADITRSQRIGLTYGDCCATISFLYTRNNTNSGLTEGSDGFRILFNFKTLGSVRPE